TSKPSPTSNIVCKITATGNHSSDQLTVMWSALTITKIASTGIEKRNSTPLLNTMRLTQIERGIDVERTSRASLRKARVKSETDVLNHTHGSSARMRNTMYGCSPMLSRLNT